MTGCVRCVTVRHGAMTHPLTCGFVPLRSFDAPRGASGSSDNHSQTVFPQVTALTTTTNPRNSHGASNPLTHPLTCGNTPCVTNGHIADPLCRNEIRVRQSHPYGACARMTHAHTHTPAREGTTTERTSR